MKKIYKIALLFILILGVSSCDFETENYQDIPTTDAYKSVQDVQNGMNGAYYALGSYRFCGNYTLAFGDMSGGICKGNAGSGHFYNIGRYVVSETTAEIEDVWDYGFKIIDRSTRTIIGAKSVLGNASALHLSDEDVANIDLYMAQCHALRALANYYLVNFFSYPYSAGRENLGLPLVKDKPIEAFEKIDRSTVGATYDFILEDISSAEALMDEALQEVDAPSAFYMGPMGIASLKARVYMDMANYTEAKKAALEALELKGLTVLGAETVPSDDNYLSMWSSLAITQEDLFTIPKYEADNLSANSLNTLYGSYYGTVANTILPLFGDDDIRANLLENTNKGVRPKKFDGIATSAATSNIPVFRRSEMALIVAEVEARDNNIIEAQKYLFYTAKRNKAITAPEQLPSTSANLLAFISEERIREFFAEGHRFYDARRMGDLVSSEYYKDFDIAKFVFPIPADEINAGACTQQNEGWNNNLPE